MAAKTLGRILLMPKGVYSNSITYKPLDWVRFNGATYVCKLECIGIDPADGSYWQLLAKDGETGKGFSIFKTYPSIADMEADFANVDEGELVLIASNVEDPDNAKLFVRSVTDFTFLTDMSGAQGIKGDKGDKGDGVADVQKTASGLGPDGLIDRYTMTFTDPNLAPFDFFITNGKDGMGAGDMKESVYVSAGGNGVVLKAKEAVTANTAKNISYEEPGGNVKNGVPSVLVELSKDPTSGSLLFEGNEITGGAKVEDISLSDWKARKAAGTLVPGVIYNTYDELGEEIDLSLYALDSDLTDAVDVLNQSINNKTDIDNKTIVRVDGKLKVNLDEKTVYYDEDSKKIKTKGGSGGSIIKISTLESSFYDKEVTVSLVGGTEVVTATFDSNGKCEVNVQNVGTYIVSVTDSDGTFTQSVIITAFSIYEVTIAKFKASIPVNVNGGHAVGAGAIVYAKLSDGTTFNAVTDSSGNATIQVGKKGDYTITASKDGVTTDDSKSVSIQSETVAPIQTLAFAHIDLSWECENSIDWSITNGSFNRNGSATDSGSEGFFVPSIGNYTFEVDIDGESDTKTFNVSSYDNFTLSVSADYVTLNITTDETDLQSATVQIYKGTDNTGILIDTVTLSDGSATVKLGKSKIGSTLPVDLYVYEATNDVGVGTKAITYAVYNVAISLGWNGILYDNGDEYTQITGGWNSNNITWRNGSTNFTVIPVEKESDGMYIDATGDYKIGAVATQNKISFDGYSKICVSVDKLRTTQVGIAISESKTVIQNDLIAAQWFSDVSTGLVSIPIPDGLLATAYLFISASNDKSRHAFVKKIWLE